MVQRTKSYFYADSTDLELSDDILFPYAWDEWMCRQLTSDSPSYIHVWQHPKAIVLGLRDRQLPGIDQAISWLENQGYVVAVRNSGGAAVPLDTGVVNISLVIPKSTNTINFRDDFETMIQLLREILAPWTSTIQTGEIKGGYCPGDYDLSINGRKFCGIAQRRQAHGFVVSAFVNVEGTDSDRASRVRTFYDIASNGKSDITFPLVEPERTSSLEELAGVPSVKAFMESLKYHKSVIVSETQAAKEALNNVIFPVNQIFEVIKQLKRRYAVEPRIQ
ncbi:lipoate--protein ligase family protein [Paenibacillus psychroresistens]|uniref:Lipoate--protein ligase family protein n=1 Tax=Paenibacillus psychroresistens TaxID=1778678 RepID=A0A6B8RIV3_9BACL|nr:lipoate--protein ligase family protein [Paenibacillus psychroresistens]QGQ95989.1 lipoate--protein ligase family protein [Paenibacillus psychroresistens]